MADVAIAAVVRKVVDIAGNLVVDEGSRLYWLPEEMQWLESQLRHMQAYGALAEAEQITNSQVENLVKDIRDLAQDVEDILDTYIPKIESHRSGATVTRAACIVPYCLTCSNFAREIGKIRKRVEAIDATRKSYGIPDTAAIGADRVSVDPRVVGLHFDEPVVVGLNKDIADLKMKLLSDEEELLFVSIVGMPGIGKTTLAKKVFKSVKDQFDCSAMVYVSQEPNVNDLLENIAEQVGLQEEKRKRNLQANLHAFLQKKRYVILLDDIWRIEAWDKLNVSFPVENMNGSRIVITSRDIGVGRYIGHERSLHSLQPFDFPTSWNLFNTLITPSLNIGDNQGFENSTLGNIGQEIVKRCGGVPLAIVVTIGLLRERGTDEFAWNHVLKSIGHNTQDKCSQILALSYRDLPSTLKPCFLYLGIFPEDHEIHVSELIRLWMAEKFVEGCTRFEPEDVGEDYMSKLAARNLVQVVSRKFDGRIKCIRIHDLLHSLCANISKGINFFHTIFDGLNPHPVNRALRFSVHPSANVDITLNNRILKVRTVLFFNSRQEISRKLIKRGIGNRRLQVLSMNNFTTYWSDRFNIKKLSHLSYIRNFCRGLSGIQNIKNLQSLDLRGIRSITNVPMAIWTMKQLRHFLLNMYIRMGSPHTTSGVDNLRRMLSIPDQIISLPNLQTLHRIHSSNIDFLGHETFPNLRKFRLWGSTDETIVKQLSGAIPISAKLEILSIDGSILTETLDLSRYQKLMKLEARFLAKQLPQSNQFPPNLLKLTLMENNLEEDPMQVLKKLPKLKILVLGLRSYEGRSLDCSGSDGFPQLLVLHLKGLYHLEEVMDGEERGMPKLREFKAESCYRLESIPQWLQQLRTSTISKYSREAGNYISRLA